MTGAPWGDALVGALFVALGAALAIGFLAGAGAVALFLVLV